MNEMNAAISNIGVVPVIKLNHPERDAAKLGKALCAGGVPVAEITFRAAGADKAIKLMKSLTARTGLVYLTPSIGCLAIKSFISAARNIVPIAI